MKRRLRNTLTSSIGWSVRRSQSDEQREDRGAESEGAEDHRVGPAALGGLDQPPHDRGQASDREAGAREVERLRLRVARLRDQERAGDQAATTIGMLTRKTLLQSKFSISQPPVIGPMAMPIPATADQMAIAFGRSFSGKMLVRIERVVGMIAAAPTPIRARDAISCVVPGATAASSEPTPKTDQPEGQGLLAAEAIAQAARDQQQHGEHEQIAVHDPLQLARAGVELLLDRRQRDVQDRVVDGDDQQAQRQHDERLPAAGVGGVGADIGSSLGFMGSATSVTLVAVERSATKNGSSASASASVAASTAHQIAWPPRSARGQRRAVPERALVPPEGGERDAALVRLRGGGGPGSEACGEAPSAPAPDIGARP